MYWIIVFVTLLLFHLTLIAQVDLEPPSGIQLLRSTKADLVKFGEIDSSSPSVASFFDGRNKVDAIVSRERCIWHGWDVPDGTILSLRVYAKPKAKLPDDFGYGAFVRITDQTMRTYLINQNYGIEFFLEPDSTIISKNYFVPRSNSDYRCIGFPEFSPISEKYSEFVSFGYRNFEQFYVGGLDEFFIRLEHNPRLKGTVFIYFDDKSEAKARLFQDRVEKFVANRYGTILSSRLRIRLGGRRDENSIQAFIVFVEDADPIPRPKYSTPSLFK